MPADWAAQRVKGLSLGNAIVNALKPKRKQTAITSLIEEFQYPKFGPGMMWEVCAEKVVALGGAIEFDQRVTKITATNATLTSVTVSNRAGEEREVSTNHLISTMPMRQLVAALSPTPPKEILDAGEGLHYRDFLTVALVVPGQAAFTDNWIYIHSAEVKVGRIQNFGSWSPYMVKDGKTCLGLEYFVFEGDELWTATDEELIERATRELVHLGLVDEGRVERGFVVRVPKAYPYYDGDYKENVAKIEQYLENNVTGVHLVGRNGMHKYNNQDHSMLTAMLTVENLHGATHDIWAVNVEEEYHEQSGRTTGAQGTGRDAPILPKRQTGN
jgi:protoporphyrinogen oxidase